MWKEIAREGMDISPKFGYPCMDAVLPFFFFLHKKESSRGWGGERSNGGMVPGRRFIVLVVWVV